MPMKNPAHPGRLIRSELDYLQVSVADGAKALGVSRSQLNRVIAGDSAVTPEMALRLEEVIGSTADHWLRMQMAFDLAQANSRKAEITKGLKRLAPQVA